MLRAQRLEGEGGRDEERRRGDQGMTDYMNLIRKDPIGGSLYQYAATSWFPDHNGEESGSTWKE